MSMIVELGQPVDLIKYISLNWHERLHFVSEILNFLERLRPLKFLDFRRQQVTIVHRLSMCLDCNASQQTANVRRLR
jgi:hypothetical protein